MVLKNTSAATVDKVPHIITACCVTLHAPPKQGMGTSLAANERLIAAGTRIASNDSQQTCNIMLELQWLYPEKLMQHTKFCLPCCIICRYGFVGKETLNVTTAQGVTSITIDVTPGSCSINLCGLQRQSGSCEQGRCSCVSGSQLTPTFARNPDAAARAVVPVVPACRYRNFARTGRFSLAGITASPGETLDITFTLAQPGVQSQCAGPDAALLPVVKLLKSSCSKRVAPAAEVQQISVDVAACEGGVYSAQVEVPAGSAGACYVVAVALADGSVKRAALKVV
jgi:hypothetical protein